MKSVALHNLGCKVNSYEFDVMQQMLQENGFQIVSFDERADVYVVNTCTVTNMADRKSRQMLLFNRLNAGGCHCKICFALSDPFECRGIIRNRFEV